MEGKICPQCKTINPTKNKFCYNCGYSLSNAEIRISEEVKTSEEDEIKNIKQTEIISTTEERQNIEQKNNNEAKLVSQNNNEEKLNNSKTNSIYTLPLTPQDLAPNVNFKELSPELRERAELWTLYVKERAYYYIPRFIEFHTLGNTTSWNWAAFFFPFYWSLFRKVYIVSLIVFIPTFLFGLLFGVVYGIFANYIYYKHVDRKVEKILLESRLKNLDPKVVAYFRGGTSFVGILVFILLIILLFFIMAMLED